MRWQRAWIVVLAASAALAAFACGQDEAQIQGLEQHASGREAVDSRDSGGHRVEADAALVASRVLDEVAAPGLELELEIRATEEHLLSVVLDEGDYLHARVEQLGVDLTMSLLGPDGHLIHKVDSPTGQHGPESLEMVADVSGKHRLGLNATGAPDAGRYRLHLLALRPAARVDRARAEASVTHFQAEQQRLLSTEQSQLSAIGLFRQAAEQWRDLADPHLEAISTRRLAQVLAARGRLDSARTAFERSFVLFKASGDLRSAVGCLVSMAVCHRREGRVSLAELVYDEALQLATAIDYGRARVQALMNLGAIAYHRGDIELALERLEEAMAEIRLLPGAETMMIDALNLIVMADCKIGRLEHAEGAARQALELLERLDSPRHRIESLMSVGWLRYRQDRVVEALQLYAQAQAVEAGHEQRLLRCGILDHKGAALRKAGRLGDAELAYRQALEIAVDAGLVLDQANQLCNLAELELERDRAGSAEELSLQAVERLERLGDRETEAHARYLLARSLEQQGRLVQSQSQLEVALERVEHIRRSSVRRSLRTAVLSARVSYVELLVEVLMQRHERDPEKGHAAQALSVAERYRARALLDLILEAGPGPRRQVSAELLDEESAARAALNGAEERRRWLLGTMPSRGASEAASEQLSRVESEIAGLVDTLDRLEAEIRELDPSIAALAEPETIQLGALEGLLDGDGSAVLFYAFGERRSFVWLVGGGRVDVEVLPPRGEIERLAGEVNGILRTSHRMLVRPQAYAAAVQLGSMVVGPIAARVGQIGPTRLVVVPDGKLAAVPFAALVPGPGRDPLLVDHEIVVSWSLSSIVALRRARHQQTTADHSGEPGQSKSIALIADPIFSTSDPRVTGLLATGLGANAPTAGPSPIDSSQGDKGDKGNEGGGSEAPHELCGYDRLPFAGSEAAAILSYAGKGRVLLALGAEARKELFFAGVLRGIDIIHIVTHAQVDTSYPELSTLALSCVDSRGLPVDGHLRAFELYGLDLSADLVVLSACETALGKEVQGEGLVGLTQGFLQAGAASVLVSLWKVNDRATAQLMGAFYRSLLEEDLAPAAALRQAQLEIRQQERWKEPYYWAGFVLGGDWSALSAEP